MKLCDVFRNYTYKCGFFKDKLAAPSEANMNVATEWVQLPQMTVIRIAIVTLDTEDLYRGFAFYVLHVGDAGK